MVLHHQSYKQGNVRMEFPQGNVFSASHPDPPKKGLSLGEESLNTKPGAFLQVEMCTKNSQKDRSSKFVSITFFTRHLHPPGKSFKEIHANTSRLFFPSAHKEGTLLSGIRSLHGLENGQTESTQGNLQCIET